MGLFDDIEELVFLDGGGEPGAAGPVDIIDTSDPCGAEFAGKGRWFFRSGDVAGVGEKGGGEEEKDCAYHDGKLRRGERKKIEMLWWSDFRDAIDN